MSMSTAVMTEVLSELPSPATAITPITPITPVTPLPLRRDAYGRMVAIPRRERARRGQGEKLREEILEAAEFLLAKYGHDDAVSIRAVANRVGCTPPAIYLHFTDKTQLLFEVCARRFAELSERIDAAVEGQADPLTRLAAGSRAYITFGLEHPEHYRILFMQKPLLTPEQWRDLRFSGTAGIKGLEQRVQNGIDAGQIAGDAHQIAMAIWQLCHGIVSLIIAKPDWGWHDVDVMTQHLLGTYLKGLRPD
jgi:AcrR family transcriptional regulator